MILNEVTMIFFFMKVRIAVHPSFVLFSFSNQHHDKFSSPITSALLVANSHIKTPCSNSDMNMCFVLSFIQKLSLRCYDVFFSANWYCSQHRIVLVMAVVTVMIPDRCLSATVSR